MNQFSIDYPEYHIAGHLQKDFPKGRNYSIAIPFSRQQKYFDLFLYNANNKKCLTIQVKSSRTYLFPDTTDTRKYNYYAWLNTFTPTIYADFYFIFITFPLFDLKTFRPKTAFGTKILVFSNSEISDLLNNIKFTRTGHQDKFFSFGFNFNENKIYGDRGFDPIQRPEFTTYLYENRIEMIKNSINS